MDLPRPTLQVASQPPAGCNHVMSHSSHASGKVGQDKARDGLDRRLTLHQPSSIWLCGQACEEAAIAV